MKKYVFLFLIFALVLLVAAGCGSKKAPEEVTSAVYWNVDRVAYLSGASVRLPRDGYYMIRMAVDGKQVDVPVKDLEMVRLIDTMEVMGFVFDEEGIVTDVLRIEEFFGDIPVEDYYVTDFSQEYITVSSVAGGRGYSHTFQLGSNTVIYRADAGSPLTGMPGELELDSRVLLLRDKEGEIAQIWCEPPFEAGDVYWNTKRMYSSANKMSTRSSDELGYFNYTFAVNGELVELKTKDQAVANKIDSIAAKCMGLRFDEDGNISGVISTKLTVGGSSFGSWYHVTDIQDNGIVSAYRYANGSNKGKSVRGTLADDCKIYDVSGTGAYIGEPTQLRLYDQIHGLRNNHGQIGTIFVVSRSSYTDIYWNYDRQWNSRTKETKRVPDEEGWYTLTLAVNGEQKILRTKDKDIVNSIDSTAVRCCGLDTDGDVITEFFATTNVWGGKQFCSWDYVTDIEGDVVTATESDSSKEPKDYVGPMAADCKVYNVSEHAAVKGEKTTLQVGDRIHALKDLDGNITHIFVVERPLYVPIYWNVERKWNSSAEQTKRTPNEEGYYEFLLATDGKQVTLKTKSKAIANSIDGTTIRCFGLATYGDEIVRYYKASEVASGKQFCSWDYVTDITGLRVTAKEADAAKGDKTYQGYMRTTCGVYDMTGNGLFVGEKTTLQVGDQIHALRYSNGGIKHIFVVGRELDTDVYWNVERKWNSTAKQTKRTPNEEGYYEILLAVNGEQKLYKTADLDLVNAMDGTAVRCFGLRVNGDIIEKYYSHLDLKNGHQYCSWDYVTQIGEDGTVVCVESDNYNKTYTGKLTEQTVVYNVSKNYEAFAGEVTDLRLGDRIHGLRDNDRNLTVLYVVEREKEQAHKFGVCSACGQMERWTAWDGSTTFSDGHYYLNNDINVTATAYIGSDSNSGIKVCLDLCGFDITSTKRVFRIYGTMNLMDSGADSVITSSSTGQGAGFYVYDNGVFNMYGGTFKTAGQQNSQSGLGAMGVKSGSKAVFNMYGGKLIGGDTKKGGGTLDMFHSSTFNLYGGIVEGGKTLTNGGTIAVAAAATVNIYGGTVTAGQATGKGDCIYAAGKVTLYEGNKITVDQIYLLAGKTIAIDGILAQKSSVGILLADITGIFSDATVEDNASFFSSAEKEILFSEGVLSVE